MKFKEDTSNNAMGFFPTVIIVIMSIFIYIFSFLYKILIKKPVESILNWLIEPMIDVLDDEKIGLTIIGIFLIEVLLTLIIPWFFSVWVGLGFLVYFIVYFSFIVFVLNEDSKIHISIFLAISLPYLILLSLPTLSVVIFRKRPEKQLTLLETRIIKLKRIKRKVKHNKLKFWKR